MRAGGIHHAELILLLLLALVGTLTTLSRRFQTPYPIVLVIGGLLLSFVPNLPHISLNPDIVFLVLLPPLLFAAAFNTSWHDFRFHIVSILLLAFGLVAFTVVGVSAAAEYLLPGFDWRLGLVLGAVICSTDAIAATSIAQRVGLPRAIVDTLEGESLVNDASALLALEFAAALVVNGQKPSFFEGTGRLLFLVGGGLVVGLASGWVIRTLQRRLIDPPIEITLSLMAPYISYLLAEALRVSGPLATVVCGLYLGRNLSEVFTTEARLQNSAVWNTLDFILNGLVFILIGLQLPLILQGIRSIGHRELIFDAAVLSVVVIALRLMWMYPGAWLGYFIRARLLKQNYKRPDGRSVFVLGWTGMRGVLALGAAFSLPRALQDGSPFPQRELIIFLTFAVILVTLVLQGLTLPTIIRKFGLSEPDPLRLAERDARRRMLRAALDYLDSVKTKEKGTNDAVWHDTIQHYRELYAMYDEQKPDNQGSEKQWIELRDLGGDVRTAERAALKKMRSEDRISDHVLRKLERELDLLDTRFISE
ncbi:MAG TPA: Na+/H+ antiporter [Acidobacteriaceae bacterium]